MIQAIKDEVGKFKARVEDFRTAGDVKRSLATRRAKADEAKKNYNVPAQITDEDRRKAKEEADRAKREMESESDISKGDKDALKELIDKNDEAPKPFRKGGMVNKSSKSGSRRGDGCAVRGRTKGKMY
jgi:long-subunit fatty acid transport protein